MCKTPSRLHGFFAIISITRPSWHALSNILLALVIVQAVEICLTTFQLRVTAARPGTVNFELEIQKEHTVRLSLDPALNALDRPC